MVLGRCVSVISSNPCCGDSGGGTRGREALWRSPFARPPSPPFSRSSLCSFRLWGAPSCAWRGGGTFWLFCFSDASEKHSYLSSCKRLSTSVTRVFAGGVASQLIRLNRVFGLTGCAGCSQHMVPYETLNQHGSGVRLRCGLTVYFALRAMLFIWLDAIWAVWLNGLFGLTGFAGRSTWFRTRRSTTWWAT